jgi:hypothetical protein
MALKEVDMIAKHLEEYRKNIDNSKRTIAQQEGQVQQIWKSLEPFGVKNEEQLKKKIAEQEKKRGLLHSKINTNYEALTKEFTF